MCCGKPSPRVGKVRWHAWDKICKVRTNPLIGPSSSSIMRVQKAETHRHVIYRAPIMLSPGSSLTLRLTVVARVACTNVSAEIQPRRSNSYLRPPAEPKSWATSSKKAHRCTCIETSSNLRSRSRHNNSCPPPRPTQRQKKSSPSTARFCANRDNSPHTISANMRRGGR